MLFFVCINSISPMAIGCRICVYIKLIIVLIDTSNFFCLGMFYLKFQLWGLMKWCLNFPLNF